METIQLIKENIRIKDLADSLRLKRSGGLYYCINPTHRDDTPSLKLYDDTNSFYCFGCDTGGDVIKFYQLANNVSDFTSALKDLSNYIGIPYNPSEARTSRADRPAVSIKKPLRPAKNNPVNEYKFLCDYDNYYFDERAGVFEFEAGYSRNNAELLALRQVRHERLQRNKIIFNELYEYCNTSGLDESIYNYLSNVRKLSDDVISKSKLFSLNDIPSITKHLTGLFDIQELQGSGLFKNDKLLFSNSHRLIIPYIENKEIIYLRSRYFDGTGNKTNNRKYYGLMNDDLNLNRTKRFYNLDTLNEVGFYDKVYMTEGEIDCLTLETIGLKSIAVPGITNLPDNLQDLINIHIVIAFDNDKNGRGQEATRNTARVLKKNLIKYSVLKLPDGIKDINEFLINEFNINKKC